MGMTTGVPLLMGMTGGAPLLPVLVCAARGTSANPSTNPICSPYTQLYWIRTPTNQSNEASSAVSEVW